MLFAQMETVERYRVVAREYFSSYGPARAQFEFSERFPHDFLVKRPESTVRARPDELMRFETAPIDLREVSDEHMLTRGKGRLLVVPLTKRDGNPYPERLSVGRASNCDVPIRLSSVSKLHAHIIVGDDGVLRVVDRSANGTEVNGRRLEQGAPTPLLYGDRVCFGGVELELLSNEQFYDLVLGTS